jgi:hypothetical protein
MVSQVRTATKPETLVVEDTKPSRLLARKYRRKRKGVRGLE